MVTFKTQSGGGGSLGHIKSIIRQPPRFYVKQFPMFNVEIEQIINLFIVWMQYIVV